MLKRQRIIASILLCIIIISNLATPVAYAAEMGKFHVKQPAENLQNTSTLAASLLLPQPDKGSVLGASTSLLTTETVPLDINGDNDGSANTRIAPSMEELTKKVYRTDQDVEVSVVNPDSEPFTTGITDAKGDRVSVPITESDDGTVTNVDISSSDSIRPGMYTVNITDADGQTTKQDFTWGVLAMNFDKSEYHPGETGDIAFAVLNNNGDMVCDAQVSLQISNQAQGITNILTTSSPGASSSASQITVNPQCQQHDYSLVPDYEAHYTFTKPGTYTMALTATTTDGSHSISDSITVTNDIPFDVQRVSATRIYPPNTYPVLFNITANRDFNGTVTETVPDSFTITPATQAAVEETGQGGSVSSYSNMQTVYLDNNDPAANMQQAIIASDSSGLVMPFTGSYPITQGFGAELTDPTLQAFYTSFGLAGHDGVDFGVPMFTPLYAVDNGKVIWSGPGDYGITIIISHGWGESYYGHLSSTVAKVGQSVTKGELIGYSGESGDATGPHLHFGMRPNNPDMTNGYYGKIDPLPYLPFGHEPQPLSSLNPTGTLATAGQQLGGVLGASDEASPQPEATQTPTPSSQPTVSPTISPVATTPTASSSAEESSVSPTESAEEVSPIQTQQISTPTPRPLSSVEATQSVTAATNERFSVLEKQIQLTEALDASIQTEKVKVITWQVSLKKGESTTLGYDFQAPRVSPEFYLLGPLKFYANGSNKIIYQEQRQWEIASDDVGVEWYSNNSHSKWNGYSWQYRKKIDINHSEVSASQTNFPVLVNLSSDNDLKNKAQSSGNDILFTDSTGENLLTFEIENYNSSTGSLQAWVDISSLSSSNDTIIYMYYGNPAASSNANGTGVWDSNYKGVWHLDQTPPATLTDSTSNANNGTPNNSPSQVSGEVGGSLQFNGSSQYVNLGSGSSLDPGGTQNFTVESWVKRGSSTATGTILDRGLTNSSNWCNTTTPVVCNSNWQYRKTITFNNASSSTTLTNFPVMVELTTSNFTFSHAESTGYDIVFTDSSGNALDFERVSFTSGTSGYFWVNVPSIAAGSTTGYIYMYYGNSSVSTDPVTTAVKNATWNSNYKGVWYFNQTPSFASDTLKDSSSDDYNCTPAEGSSGGISLATAMFGADWDFDTDFGPNTINCGTSVSNLNFSGNVSTTVEFWYKTLTSEYSENVLNYSNAYSGSDNQGYYIGWGNSSPTCSGSGWWKADKVGQGTDICVGTVPTDGDWHYADIVWTPTGNTAYFDGSASTPTDSQHTGFTANTSGNSFYIATTGSGGGWSGQIADLRISNTALSADWIKATYLSESNQYDTFGTEQTYGSGVSGYAFDIGISPCTTNEIRASKLGVGEMCLGTFPTDTTTFHQVAVVFDSGGAQLYIDGAANGSKNTSVTGDFDTSSGTTTYMGGGSGVGGYLNGTIDETRVASTNRSASWIQTEYNNESSPSSFYTVEATPESDIYAPTLHQLLRHGEFFGTQGVESGVRQPFMW